MVEAPITPASTDPFEPLLDEPYTGAFQDSARPPQLPNAWKALVKPNFREARCDAFRFLDLSDTIVCMKVPAYLDVDPRTLHLPSTRPTGVDPFKLQRQVAQYGSSTQGMPPLLVYRGTDGGLMIFDGVTRATRVATLRPGELVRVEVIGELAVPCTPLLTVGDQVP